MFTRMLRHALPAPARFGELAGELFRAMASGGRVGFETVDWFNGSLFNDNTTLPLLKSDIQTVLEASDLDWSEIDPSILGTLFERGLDPNKRAQLGAHYTDRDKIMLLVEPVVIRPLLTEWDAEKTAIAAELERAEAAKSRPARTKRLNAAEQRYRAFLNRLRGFKVLDPACGSGNFLYLALQALKDLEHRVQLEAEALGFQRAFPEVGPANVKGIETNPYAAEMARVSVWIGEIQWMRRNGFGEARDPILKPLDTIECRDAIPDTGQLRAGVAVGRRRHRQPAIPGRQTADHTPGRELRIADVLDLRGPRARRGGPSLLLVREGGPADRLGQSGAGRARCDELHPGWCEPARTAGGDREPADLRGVERRAVGDRRGGCASIAGLFHARR